jgi:hypothetical protein
MNPITGRSEAAQYVPGEWSGTDTDTDSNDDSSSIITISDNSDSDSDSDSDWVPNTEDNQKDDLQQQAQNGFIKSLEHAVRKDMYFGYDYLKEYLRTAFGEIQLRVCAERVLSKTMTFEQLRTIMMSDGKRHLYAMLLHSLKPELLMTIRPDDTFAKRLRDMLRAYRMQERMDVEMK